MINATIRKFGYPSTLVAEHAHWVVLLRPHAVTLGSLVLAARHDATAFGALPAQAFAELGGVIASIETSLGSFTWPEKINYLMLMMVDPHVHFKVIPRYAGSREFGGTQYPDAGWPGMPDLKSARELSGAEIGAMVAALREPPPPSQG